MTATTSALSRVPDTAADVGVGLLAGALGTAAMTASSTLEMTLSGRAASSTPQDAAGTVLGVEPSGPSGQQRFGTTVHWGYGTAWGAVRGLVAAVGLRGPAAAATHLGLVWGSEQVVLPATGTSSPTPRYGASATATDLLHHVVYALATSAAYEWLDRRRTR